MNPSTANQQSATDDWISQLRYDSSSVVHIPSFWSKSKLTRDHINQALYTIASRQVWPKVRLFIENGIRNDLLSKLLAFPMTYEETADDWVQRALGRDDFCMAINHLSLYNDDIATLVSEHFTVPITKRLGVLAGGYEVYAFIGKYEATPFGIHDDQDHSLLLHLGPNPQEVLIWQRSLYKRIAGEAALDRVDFDIDDKKAYAQRLTLQENDLLLIPKGDFHVFLRPQFSMTLGLIPRPLTHIDLLQKIVGEYLSDLPNATVDASYLSNEARAAGPKHEAVSSLTSGDLTVSLQQGAQQVVKRLESNGYLNTMPMIDDGTVSIQPNTTIVTKPFFPITYTKHGERLQLYVRGRALNLRNIDKLEAIIGFINSNQKFTMLDIIRASEEKWSPEVAQFILKQFVTMKALKIQTSTGTLTSTT